MLGSPESPISTPESAEGHWGDSDLTHNLEGLGVSLGL